MVRLEVDARILSHLLLHFEPSLFKKLLLLPGTLFPLNFFLNSHLFFLLVAVFFTTIATRDAILNPPAEIYFLPMTSPKAGEINLIGVKRRDHLESKGLRRVLTLSVERFTLDAPRTRLKVNS